MPVSRLKKESGSGSDDSTAAATTTKEGYPESSKIKRNHRLLISFPRALLTRSSVGCDACRARKSSCKHCITLGIPCTYDYQPKKRGPPNLYLRRLQEAAAAAAAQQQQDNQNGETSPLSARPNMTGSRQQTTTIAQPSSSFLEQSLNNVGPSLPSGSLQSSHFAITTDAYHSHYQPMSSSSFGTSPVDAQRSPKADDTQSFMYPTEQFSTYPLYNWSYRQHQQVSTPNTLPPLSYYYRPHKRDPLFFSLVMSTVASTLVQLPRSYLPMGRHAVRKLAQTCHEASRHISVVSYDPPTSMHVVIRYLDCIYHFCEGHDATQHAAFGEAAHIAVTLRMHEESSYDGLDLIECEVRRRTFWLLFGADKSMSILLGRPICLRDEDCTVHFPKELDDEYITPSAYLPQPHGKPSLVSGLNCITRIFALLGEILVRIRVDRRSPPQGQYATARLEEVRSLHTRIMSALVHTPEPLRLKQNSQPNIPSEYGGASFRQATFAEVKDFFDNPNASRANALNPFLVMQANIYVTQQLVRFVIEQYRDELEIQIRGTTDDQRVADEQRIADDREAVASDLLNILHKSVHKVRFVASTLLDAVRKAETAPATAARAHAYLWDFLSILSEIERNYLLDDDRDATSNGDGMPTLLSNN
ncbi:hypothetical protein EDB89DRAFT_1926297 [Lactarius sanguifluus]|nr:hypothetical protein EDB89DRAFT_1926297 [Lactarius sanguifluus]